MPTNSAARTAPAIDKARPVGIIAQASRACTNALMNPVTHNPAAKTNGSQKADSEGNRLAPENAITSNASDAKTIPPMISQEEKFIHWIW